MQGREQKGNTEGSIHVAVYISARLMQYIYIYRYIKNIKRMQQQQQHNKMQ